jgi:hypothetical protein
MMRRALILLFVLCSLVGCTPAQLAAVAAGAQTAESVARAGCALLQNAASSGNEDAILAALGQLQKDITAARAKRAVQRGAEQAAVDGLIESMAVMQQTLAEMSRRVGALAGEGGPVKVEPCPVAPATSSAPLLPPPAATAPLGAAPVVMP